MSKFNEIINGDTPVLVDFFADWCGPCQTMNPIISELAVDLKGAVKILKVNIDKNQSVSSSFGVRGVPTFVLFKKGKEVWRASGAMPKSEINSRIKPFL
jgi:thioredoxin 1